MAVTIDGAAGSIDATGNLDLQDNDKIVLGTGNDFVIYHNGTDAIIDAEESGATRNLYLKGGTTTDRWIELQSSDGEPHVRCAANSYVKLYHDNSQKLETIATGINITGGIRLGGNNAANEIDDYEEGTWTATCANSVTLESNKDLCQYIKIGSLVWISGAVQVDSDNGGADFTINNLPFTNNNSGLEESFYSPMAVRYSQWQLPTNHVQLNATAYGGGNELKFYVSFHNANNADLDADTGGWLSFAGCYHTTQ